MDIYLPQNIQLCEYWINIDIFSLDVRYFLPVVCQTQMRRLSAVWLHQTTISPFTVPAFSTAKGVDGFLAAVLNQVQKSNFNLRRSQWGLFFWIWCFPSLIKHQSHISGNSSPTNLCKVIEKSLWGLSYVFLRNGRPLHQILLIPQNNKKSKTTFSI